jgi:tRNA A-37 threonylcarbamoyl transferase component Bud32
MRVRLDTYERVHASIRRRSLVLLVLGALGVVFGSFVGLLGVFMLFMTDGGLWENRAGVVLGLFGGVFPVTASVLMLWRGWVGRTRIGRLRELAALARSKPAFASRDVAEALHLRPIDAERLVLDAAALGLMEEGGPAEAVAALSGVRAVQFAPTLPGLPPATVQSAPGEWVGSVLNGTYRIERHLGSGGMGMVYAARHLRTGRRYAIKTLLPDARLSPDAIKRFEREATAASALGHAGIVAVHDFHETADGVHYLVMDLLEGETLEERLGRVGSLAWPEAQRIALEVGSALAAAHDQGLLHRDLKPANIFLATTPGGPERAVLLDFGLAKPLAEAGVTRLTQSGAAVGTPMYMSPEQARGEALDVRSDVYGLAAVVFEMVTGAPPFFDRTLAGVYAKLLTESAPRVGGSGCPAEVDDVLACALAKTPGERFASIRAFGEALGHVGVGVQRSA